MLLLSSDFLHRLPKPGVSGLTSVADARHCWFRWKVCRHLRFPLLKGNYDDKVIPPSPTLLVFLCMVAADDDLLLCSCEKQGIG
jgi:hypothetical protein